MTLLRRLFAWIGPSAEPRSAIVEEVEPRILYSADLNPALWATDATAMVADLHSADAAAPLAAAEQQQVQRREIVFVDAAVPDAQKLIDGVLAARGADAQIEIVQIQGGADGVAQISAVLAEESDLSAVHIIAHGSDGVLALGNTHLDAARLAADAEAVAGWGRALAADGDLLLYGCDVARSEVGQSFVNDLARLTGADVAASIDQTGSTAIGGNWTLEFATGVIHTSLTPSSFERLEWTGVLATYTVTSTADTNASGTLRWAIEQANSSVGVLDTIRFNIGGGGAQTINVNGTSGANPNGTGLDYIVDPVILDATSQPGYAGTPLITLNGASATGTTAGLVLRTNDSTIKGFIVINFNDEGLEIDGSTGAGDRNIFENNWVGITAAGAAAGNADNGIMISEDADDNIVRNNVVGSSGNNGIIIRNAGSDNNWVYGNIVGLAADASTVRANAGYGIYLSGDASNNFIGSNTDGSNDAAEGNIVSGNAKAGIGIQTNGGGNAILRNSVYGNALLGIDLGTTGVTANDANDVDTGANGLQNFPVLTAARVITANQVSMVGSLNSLANSYFRVEFFANTAADGSGYGEGQRYLGFANVATDGSGNATINATLTAAVSVGEIVSATATRSNNTYTAFTDTSEFAQNATATNTAPTITNGATVVLAATNEDTTSAATSVNAILTGAAWADADSGAMKGIAVTSKTGNGSWQYSTDGLAWNGFGTVSATNALLLTSTSQVRYLADGLNGETATFAFRAWDQTTGTASTNTVRGFANPGAGGGTTAYSTGAATASMTVTAVNDAPTVTDRALSFDGTDLVVVATQPSLVMSSTLTIDATVQRTGALGASQLIVNKEGEYEVGISATGQLQWAFANATPGWTFIETAFTVPADTWVHIAVSYNAGVVKTYVDGTLVDTYNGTGNIGDVYPAMNDLTIGGRQNATTQRFVGLIDEVRVWNLERSAGQIQAAYNTVLSGAEAGLVGYWRFSESSGTTAIDSSPQGNHGVLGNGVPADVPTRTTNLDYTVVEDNTLTAAASGVLAFASDPEGSPVTAVLVSGPTNAASFTLNPNGSFSYTPTANFNGVDSFTFRASDGSLTSPLATVTLTVTAVNDAPVASGSVTLAAINEDTASPPGATVSSLFSGNFSDASDQVAGGSSANTFAGIAISNYTVDAAKGNWQYSTNTGGSWTTLGSATTTAAITLDAAASTMLRFVPAANYNGAATALSANLIESGLAITNGATINLSGATGGATRISSATVALGHTVNAVADTPSITPATTNEDTQTTSGLVISRNAGDGTEVTHFKITGITNGTLYQTDGTTVIADGSFITFAQGNAGLKFTPSANFFGTGSFTVQASTSNANPGLGGSTVNASITVNAVNDAPTLSATSLNPTFTEAAGLGTQAAAVNLFSGAVSSTVESGQTIIGLTFTVSGLVDGANEVIVVDGRTIALGVDSSGVTVSNSLAYSATLSGGTATIVLSGGTLSTTATQTLVDGITYQNTNADNPTPGNRVVRLTQVSDSGGTANGGVDTTTLSIVSTVTVNAVNDAAVLSAETRNLTETNAAIDISSSGTLTISDVDSPSTFVAQAGTAGTYGSFSIDAAGAWTYTASSAHDEFVAGTTYTDTFNIASADGTATSVTINILGTNDAAALSADTRNLTEGNTAVAISSSGTLTISDVDSPSTFVAQAGTAGSYGSFSIDAAGAWTYTASSAHDEFVAGVTYTDTFNVTSADGTSTTVTINILGTNDAAVLSSDTRNLTEGNLASDISSSGALAISDVDSPATFVAQAGSVGTYGSFSIDAAGAWTYTASSAHDEFVAGTTYTDTFNVASADGTTTSVTINILGTNDAAVLSSDTRNLTEGNTAAAISTSGTLTINDVDSPATFVAQTGAVGTYGSFSVDAAGAWTYTASSAHDEFVAGTTYTDTFTVSSADGTTTSVTVNILGTNDAAVLSSDTRNLTETNAVLDISTSGTLTISDVDSAGTFVAQTGSAGSYGSFSINAAGAWTYTASSAHDEFVAGTTYTDTFAVSSADGTTTTVTINILGTNDAAIITGTATASLTETNAAQSTGASLSATDVDGSAAFVVQSGTAGSNGYGSFSVDAAGVWTYTMNSAHDEFVAGVTYTDSFTVATADGTTQLITVSILGTNDAAVLSADVANLTETNAAIDISSSGTLAISDVDSPATFVAQASTAGTYGSFSVDAAGAWTYTASSAHDEFVAGTTYTDTFNVTSADGTTTTVTVNILGTNDVAVLSSDTRNLTETNAAIDISSSGTLTIGDVDSPATFVAQAGTAGSYGSFSIDAAGAWTYTASSAHNEFVAGTTYTDTFTVSSADGTTTTVTVNILGTNDAAVLSADTRNLTEGNTAAAISSSGTLTIGDVDSAATFVAQSGTAGTYGSFSVDAAGAWAYTASSAHDEFVAGVTYIDTFNVTSADGTATTVTINILGTNDAAVLSADVANLTETNTAADISSSGTLTISDVDSAGTFVAQTGSAGSYGSFSINAAGAWTYTASSAHDEFIAGVTYTDTFNVASADGTTTSVTINILGTNDAPVITSDGAAPTASVSVAENQTAVTTVTSADADGGTPVYTIAGGADAALFSIDSATGVLSFNAAPDFESPTDAGADNVYDVTVQVADGNGGYSTQALAITVTGVNEAPAIAGVTGGTVTAGASTGTLVATVSATDPDSGAVLTFDLLADAGGRFTIDPSSGRISVADASLLGASAQHRITVRVSDASGASDQRELILSVQALPSQTSVAETLAAPPPAAPPPAEAQTTPAPAPSATAQVPGERESPAWRQTELSRAGGEALAPTDQARAATLPPRSGGDGEVEIVPIGSVSFNLLSPAEIAIQLASAVESSLLGSIDALLRNSFGFARGQSLESEAAEQAATGEDRRPTALVDVISDPMRISSVTFTAGFVWWLTRGGGLLATMLMSLPAWRHIDLLPILARRLDDEDGDENDDFNLLQPDTAHGGLDDLLLDDDQLVAGESQLDTVRTEFEDSALGALFERGETAEETRSRP